MTARQFARTLKNGWRSLRRAARGKLRAITTGQSPVSDTCQIPDIRARYQALKLDARNGYFIEIGAFDGDGFSNTSFLADQGWRGLYVEPVPAYAAQIRLRHLLNRVSVENAAITDAPGVTQFHVMGALSTSVAPIMQAYETISWAKEAAAKSQAVTVRTDTLPAVFARHGVPENPDLVVIDVEGGEEPVVSALLASRWRPRVLVVELTDTHPDFQQAPETVENHTALRAKILASGYSTFYADHINTIFTRD